MTIKEKDDMKWLIDAIDHLRQYRDYSEAMREHGKGFTPSSQFTPNYLISALEKTVSDNLSPDDLDQREFNILKGVR